jgi:hypothetical protein
MTRVFHKSKDDGIVQRDKWITDKWVTGLLGEIPTRNKSGLDK